MITAKRFWAVIVLSFVSFLFLITRLGYLQIYCHASLLEKAQREHAQRDIEPASRGEILDRSGRVLAMSLEGGSCVADPRMVKNPAQTAEALSSVLHLSRGEVLGKLTERRRFVWLARRMDPETSDHIQALHLPGVRIIPEMKRFYPEESLAAHVLGVVGQENKGLSGVELMVNSWLNGTAVPPLFKNWSFAKQTSFHLSRKSSVPPRSLVLTIDRTLQYIAEQELAVQMEHSRPKSATVIIEDPQTGDILAMATAPTFNPNMWGDPTEDVHYGPDTLINPAVERVIEPGSTFKLITAAGALEDHIVTPKDMFFCENGSWDYQGRTIHDHEKEGWLSFTEVISHSSNIGTGKVALKMGPDRLYRYARAFGFGIPSGCGLAGDAAGILRHPNEWRPGSLATIAFGQEVGVTPLQMVNAYSAVANGGVLMTPRLYKGVIDDEGIYREWEPPMPIRRVVSSHTVAELKAILHEVVAHGTGIEAAVQGIDVGGKTGTAQKIDPETHQYSANHYIASFCGFAPLDKPRLAIGVFLDEPRGSYWGGSEAAPVFSRIVRDAAPYMHFEPASLPVGPVAILRTIPRS